MKTAIMIATMASIKNISWGCDSRHQEKEEVNKQRGTVFSLFFVEMIAKI